MAETANKAADSTATGAAVTPTSLGNATLDSYYQSFLKTLPNQQISYDPIQYERQSVDAIKDQVASYLRNYYDQSIDQRKSQTIANNAELDVDAASRGMTPSTFLSDVKGRQTQAEAKDIAMLEADYASTLAQAVQQQYNTETSNWLGVESTNRGNQIEVDEWNAAAKLALEELAYTRASQAKANGPSGGGGGGSGGSSRATSPVVTPDPATNTFQQLVIPGDGRGIPDSVKLPGMGIGGRYTK